MSFPLGRTVMTAGIARLWTPSQVHRFVERHASGDWGDVCPEDAQANEDALKHGDRIMSVYMIEGVKIYVITEADRSVTTCLKADEY